MSDADAPPTSRAGLSIFILGLWMQACMLLGVLGTIQGMRHAFDALGHYDINDPSKLRDAIGEVLHANLIGLLGNLLGMLLMLFALSRFRLRERWMFLWSMTIGVLFLPFSLPLFIYCLITRKEFSRTENDLK